MIVIPIYNGRLLKEVKRYPNFILYEDPKTKIKISYTYKELENKKNLPRFNVRSNKNDGSNSI